MSTWPHVACHKCTRPHVACLYADTGKSPHTPTGGRGCLRDTCGCEPHVSAHSHVRVAVYTFVTFDCMRTQPHVANVRIHPHVAVAVCGHSHKCGHSHICTQPHVSKCCTATCTQAQSTQPAAHTCTQAHSSVHSHRHKAHTLYHSHKAHSQQHPLTFFLFLDLILT